MQTEFPVIRTERLLLRQFTGSDLENVYQGLSHPDIIKYYGVSYNSLEATKAQMEFFSDGNCAKTKFPMLFLSIRLFHTGKV